MTGIASIRQDAARRFGELGFPTTRDEEWRFTNVSSIAKTQFSAAPSDLNAWEGAQLDPCLSLNEGGLRLVFINGRLQGGPVAEVDQVVGAVVIIFADAEAVLVLVILDRDVVVLPACGSDMSTAAFFAHADPTGLEPVTARLTGGRSAN